MIQEGDSDIGSMTSAFRAQLFRHGEPLAAEVGRIIFKQGSLGRSFYFIVEGQVELQFDGETRKILKPGDFFGELRAVGDIPRTATATCLTPCQLIRLSGPQLVHLMAENKSVDGKILAKYAARLMHSKMRSKLSHTSLKDQDYLKILSTFDRVHLPEHQYLFVQGSPADALYFVLKGRLLIVRDGEVIAIRRAGDFVGEIGILHGVGRTADVLAPCDVELFVCPLKKLNQLLLDFPAFSSYLHGLAERRLKHLAAMCGR